jgi:hypothetical protein
MKRRDFLTNTALLSAGIPLAGIVPAAITSCNSQGEKIKLLKPEELGMFSFVEIAPDGKPLKAALLGCGDR